MDPLGYNVPLPICASYYPLGSPLVVETNCEAIQQLCHKLWSRWRPSITTRPARFRIAVSEERSRMPLTPVIPRGQQHLVSVIHSPENFAICDVRESFAYAAVTRDVAEDLEYFRYHFLDMLAWLMIDAAHFAPVHGSCVALGENAIVLCGDSGAGKTSLAYACARAGWTYLSDDATHVIRHREEPWVAGRPFHIRFRESAREIFPELRRFAPKRRPNGKLDIEIESAELNLNVAPEQRASHVVFLNRKPHGAAVLDEYPVSHASAKLRELVCYGDEGVRREQATAIDKLLSLPVRELVYSDIENAEQALRRLVNG